MDICLGMRRRLLFFAMNMSIKKSACAGIGTDVLLLTCCVIRYQDVIAHQVNFALE